MTGYPKRLTIDASVAGAAAEQGNQEAVRCRDFLHRFRELDYFVVMNKKIVEEWFRHQSQYSSAWIAFMTDKRRVFKLTDGRSEFLRRRMITDAMLKDVHLLEAALATDKRIISNDDRARNSFRRVPDVRLVLWVNPSRPEEKAVEWLNRGARIESYRRLGHATGHGSES
jgi:hypothetical protein